jgi:sulfoxide reductase catalytic subunit YedY
MLIKIKKSWEIPESSITPEHLVFGRRDFLKAAGAVALAGPLVACGGEGTSAAEQAAGADPTASLYPAKRNAAYTLDREVTQEQIVTSYNNYYEFGFTKNITRAAQRLRIRPWQISIEGMVEKPVRVDFDTLIKAMPLEERLYRHRCVEAWSFAAPWTGFPMKALIDYCKPTAQATHVVLKTFMNPTTALGQLQIMYPWPYTEGLTMAEARNELAFMVTGAYGKPLAKQNGAPLRLAVPWKYGFKSIKGIQRIQFTNRRPKSYWEAVGPDEYGFWANVNPNVPHPRWSQADEELLGTGRRVRTQLYNGYAEQVASLYTNMQGEALYK